MAGVASAAPACLQACTSQTGANMSGDQLVAAEDNEAYWSQIASLYDVTDEVINLENGYWGLMARPVLSTYLDNIQEVNARNSFFARREFESHRQKAIDTCADLLGVSGDELALTRGATEALKSLIGGYNRLSPGDGIIYSDLDYDSVQSALETRAHRDGLELIRLDIPDAPSHDQLIQIYQGAIEDHPSARLLVLTHISHRTGLVVPVREITSIARAAGVDVIVDAAHSWGQIDFKVEDLDADFIGFNLHKWMGAPVGVGIAYIRKARLPDIDPDFAAASYERPYVSGRVHTGTSDFAAIMTVPAAIDLHRKIGPSNKARRLRYLRNVWAKEAGALGTVSVLTPDDPRMHGGITSFRLKGKTSLEENKAVSDRLLNEFGIFTVIRNGLNSGSCIRITPSLYTPPEHVRYFSSVLSKITSTDKI